MQQLFSWCSRRLAVLAVPVVLAACGNMFDRSRNSAPKIDAFPQSSMPSLDAPLLADLKASPPDILSDKRIDKVAVISDWGPWFLQEGVERQNMRAVVGVFDPQNSKCWTWNQVYFSRQRNDERVFFSHIELDTNEIDCSKLQ